MNQASNSPFFSIVIPTLNEEKYLPLLLNDLRAQTNKNFEVVHVDGESSDKTVKLAQAFNKKLNIQTKVVKIRNVSYQRNFGTKFSNGKWIIFMDADNRLSKDFLSNLTNSINKNLDTDIFSTLVNINKNKTLEKMSNSWLLLNSVMKKKAAFGAMIGVKNELAKKFPFDKKQKVMEDVIFVQNIVDKGYKFKIFKEPRYSVSTRRGHSEGFSKTIKSNIKVAHNYYIKGKKFENEDFGYEVNGGTS